MSALWGARRAPTQAPDELHKLLVGRLESLDLLLPRVSSDDGAPDAVSSRELAQARSRTALSCRLSARIMSEAAADEPWAQSRPPSAAFFDHPELLEHALSFLQSPAQLARVGAVCSSWYLASRMQELWEAQLRRSGRLIGLDAAPLPMPHEDEWTLFETAARIERHGCRPIDGASQPVTGKIDKYVDDLAAYEVRARSPPAPPQPAQCPAIACFVAHATCWRAHPHPRHTRGRACRYAKKRSRVASPTGRPAARPCTARATPPAAVSPSDRSTRISPATT